MDLNTLKWMGSLLVFVTGILSGVLPFHFRDTLRHHPPAHSHSHSHAHAHSHEHTHTHPLWLALLNTLAAGVFFGAGLLHMLPDAIAGFDKHDLSSCGEHLPLALLLCSAGFVLVFLIERVLIKGGHEGLILAAAPSSPPPLPPSPPAHMPLSRPHTPVAGRAVRSKSFSHLTSALTLEFDPCCESDTEEVVHSSFSAAAIGDIANSPLLTYGTNNREIHVRYYSRMFESGLRAGLAISRELQLATHQPCAIDIPQSASASAFSSSTNPVPYILLLALSVHSVITGLALGTSDSTDNETLLITVLLLHKATAAMSLAVSFIKGDVPPARGMRLLVLFATITPAGIILGILLPVSDTSLVPSVLMALSAGTFLYISIMSSMVEEFVEVRSHRYRKFGVFLFGWLLMVGISIME